MSPSRRRNTVNTKSVSRAVKSAGRRSVNRAVNRSLGVGSYKSYFKGILTGLLLGVVIAGALLAISPDKWRNGQWREEISSWCRAVGIGPGPRDTKAVPQSEISGKIVKVYDGDTATMVSSDNLYRYKLRFYGIDAPELAQSGGKESQETLSEMILNREVTVQVMDCDRYGRTLGKIYCDGRYINHEMVLAGQAWWYADYARNERDLQQAELLARRERRGLWSRNQNQPPWEYRKDEKN